MTARSAGGRPAGVVVPPRDVSRRSRRRRWKRGGRFWIVLHVQRLEHPARVRSNRWKTYGLPRPDVGNRQDATRDMIETILSLN